MTIPALSDCRPGFAPVEYNVIVITAEKAITSPSGRIIIPDSVGEREDLAQMRGLLVAVSPLAFNYDTWPDGSRKPQPGDHVMFSKYGGVVPQEPSPDGRQYRVLKDRDIMAVYDGDEQ